MSEEPDFFFFPGERKNSSFLFVGTMGDVLFQDICSCGNATGKPVVFGWAARTGGHAFPLPGNTANSFSRKFQKFPIYDQRAEKGWHTL